MLSLSKSWPSLLVLRVFFFLGKENYCVLLRNGKIVIAAT